MKSCFNSSRRSKIRKVSSLSSALAQIPYLPPFK